MRMKQLMLIWWPQWFWHYEINWSNDILAGINMIYSWYKIYGWDKGIVEYSNCSNTLWSVLFICNFSILCKIELNESNSLTATKEMRAYQLSYPGICLFLRFEPLQISINIDNVPVFIKGTDLSKRKQLTPFQHQHIQHKLCNVDYLNSDCYMMVYELLHGQRNR